MSEQPYESVSREEMILRDHLATDRTLLANERTFLAYVRTALAFLVTGVGALKLFASRPWMLAGIGFLFAALFTLAVGIQRFRTVSRRYRALRPPAS